MKQVSVDHNLENEEELLRLKSIGLDTEKLKEEGTIQNHSYTRTIGDYNTKGSYKDIDSLK